MFLWWKWCDQKLNVYENCSCESCILIKNEKLKFWKLSYPNCAVFIPELKKADINQESCWILGDTWNRKENKSIPKSSVMGKSHVNGDSRMRIVAAQVHLDSGALWLESCLSPLLSLWSWMRYLIFLKPVPFCKMEMIIVPTRGINWDCVFRALSIIMHIEALYKWYWGCCYYRLGPDFGITQIWFWMASLPHTG